MPLFLITTADERTWRRDRPVLFLGEWCRLHDRRTAWEHLDADVVPYHGDDREQCYRDYRYLCSVYEDVLRSTSDALNAHHGTAHSARYWRILIGPWVYLFTHTLFDRWVMVKRAADAYDIEGTLIVRDDPADMIPRDLKGMNPDSVSWNHYLFGRAIAHQKRIPWTELSAPARPRTGVPGSQPSQGTRTTRARLRRAIHGLVCSAQSLLTRDDEAMVIETYLPKRQEMKLQIALGQIPKRWQIPEVPRVPPDWSQRLGLRISSDSRDEFHRFLCTMVPEQIPTIYLEGYRELRGAVGALPWPRKPSVVFTSNLFQFCEPFQAWAAEKTEANVPLVIGQHGGLFGTGKWVVGEDHQVAIADRYITWGWPDERPSVYPGLVLTNVGKGPGTWNANGTLLYVTVPIRLVGYKSNSWPMGARQGESYLAEQMRFVEALPAPVRRALVLRLLKSLDLRIRSGFFDRLSRAFPDVELDDSRGPIERRIRECRLFVYAYNSTGYLETMARNIPTMIVWNPAYFELRPDAEPYFERLKDCGILHHTPEAAAAHAARVWDDVEGWWHQPAVQEARRVFCEQYARMPGDPIGVLREALLTARATSLTESPATVSHISATTEL